MPPMSNYGFDYSGGGGGGGGGYGGGGGGGHGGGGGSQPSPGGGGGGKPRKSYDEQTLIPVTCRMVLSTTSSSSPDGAGSLALRDGRELHQIKLVGAVRSVEPQSTNITYLIEDGTGLIEVKQWLDDGNDNPALAKMRADASVENVYVKIVGQVKDYDGRKSVVAYSVRKVSTGNELTHHMLEVVYSAEKFKKGDAIVGGGAASAAQSYGASAGVGFGGGMGGGGGGNRGQPVTTSMGGGGAGGGVNEAVLNFMRDNGDLEDTGADVNRCIQLLAGQYNESQIRQAVNDLAADGQVYSTIDENHYKCAM